MISVGPLKTQDEVGGKNMHSVGETEIIIEDTSLEWIERRRKSTIIILLFFIYPTIC
jgi:hypothetical protein